MAINREARLELLRGNLETLIKAIGIAPSTNPITMIMPFGNFDSQQTKELGKTYISYYQIATELYGDILTTNIPCKKQYKTMLSLTNDVIVFKRFVEATPLPVWVDKLDDQIPEKYKRDYAESHNVIDNSLKSAGMLARRLLERILIEEYDFQDKNLYQKMVKLKDKIPSKLYNGLIAVRQGGNISVHPMYKAGTNEMIEMDRDEIIFLMDRIAELLNYRYVEENNHYATITKISEKNGSRD
jgi:hypothetical protein